MNQVDYFNRQKMVLKPDTGQKIQQTRLLVIGLGAGGNEVVKNALLMGFRKLTFIDFDIIEDSNLSRTTLFTKEDIGKNKAETAAIRAQKEVLHDDPEINWYASPIEDLGSGIFYEHDIIISCVDVASARAYINDWSVTLSKPFFEMGFEGFRVAVSFFNPKDKEAPCLRSWIGQGTLDGKRNSCSGLKVKEDFLDYTPTIQAAAAMAGTLLTTELVKFMDGAATLTNKTLLYDGRYHTMRILGNKQDDNCHIHEKTGTKVVESTFAVNQSAGSVLASLKEHYQGDFFIKLPEEFLINAKCRNCGNPVQLESKKSKLFHEDLWCSTCKEKGEFRSNINSTPFSLNELMPMNPIHEEFLGKKLGYFGYQENDLVCVENLMSGEQFLIKLA